MILSQRDNQENMIT